MEFWIALKSLLTSGFENSSPIIYLPDSAKVLLNIVICLLAKNQKELQSKGNHTTKSLPDDKSHSDGESRLYSFNVPGNIWQSRSSY